MAEKKFSVIFYLKLSHKLLYYNHQSKGVQNESLYTRYYTMSGF